MKIFVKAKIKNGVAHWTIKLGKDTTKGSGVVSDLFDIIKALANVHNGQIVQKTTNKRVRATITPMSKEVRSFTNWPDAVIIRSDILHFDMF